MKQYIIIFFILSTVCCNAQNYFHRFDERYKDSSGLTREAIEKLPATQIESLCKIWGFLKYFHPAVRAGNYNWDYELFRVLHLLCHTAAAQRDDLLYNWVESFASVKEEQTGIDSTRQPRMLPDLRWIQTNSLNKNLAILLESIAALKKGDSSYYATASQTPYLHYKNEAAYAQMDYPDAGYRLLALFRYWNIIQYYYPYRYNLQNVWDSVLHNEVGKFIGAKNELEYKLAILELITQINDGHAGLQEGINIGPSYKGERRVAAEVIFVQDKFIVGYYYDSLSGKESGLLKGDVITSINNRPVEELIRKRIPSTPASNYTGKMREIAFDILSTNDTSLSLSIERNGIKMHVIAKCEYNYNLDIFERHNSADTSFKILPGNIGYINPRQFMQSYIPGLIDRLLQTKGLIIDFRYGVKDYILSLGDYLCDKEYPVLKITMPSNRQPGAYYFDTTLSIGQKQKTPYKGKLVLLINDYTQSSSESNTIAFSKCRNTTIIGSQTAGADGTVATFYLPGGVQTSMSGLGMYHADNKEIQKVGIIPDILVIPTAKGLSEGRDELLEKAIAVINGAKD